MKEYKRDKRVLIPRDEFEEEAGEGLGQLSREEAEADLGELKARMERRLRRPRAIWLPAAAAVVILVIASGILVTMLRQGSPSDSRLAQKGMAREEVIAEGDTAYMGMAGEAVTDTALIAMAQPIEKKRRADSAPVIAGISAAEAEVTTADEVFAVVEEDAGVAKVAEEPVVAMQVAEAEKVEAVQAEEVVVQAVPQARATAMKTRADADTRDREKAVAGKERAVISLPVSPQGGWDSYREWITRNLKYPEGVLPVVRQEVVVSFTVRPDSTISGLKAERSPGELITLEVFRLLREGPKWVPASTGGEAKAEKVEVTFVFK